MAKIPKPTLIVAGPGAGKTHAMVEHVVASLANLAPSRYLAAITFTNAAANSIRERVHRIATPGPNVFIGTIHGFVNRFVVAPFASPLNLLPDDRTFAELDVNKMVAAKPNASTLTPQAKIAIKKNITKSLLKKGLIPYDELIGIGREIISKPEIRSVISRRLQSLFIDEFQDTDNRHFDIFDAIRKGGETKIYAVGDPEQFVYGFTYNQRGLAHPTYSKIAFFKFREQSLSQSVHVNRRSCTEIVSFTNQFHSELEQESAIGPRNEPRVLLIEGTCLKSAVITFRARSEAIPDQRGATRRLYLGFENSLFDGVREEFGIRHITNGASQRESLLQEALDLLALCLGVSPRRACETLGLTLHEWRKYGISLLREVRDGAVSGTTSFKEVWLARLGISDIKNREDALHSGFGKFHATFLGHRHASSLDWSSSIHRAKGLEATAVLVVASTRKELMKWLVVDQATRNGDKQDKCRLGFVAFSRAMELLCVAVLEPLDESTLIELHALGIRPHVNGR